MDSYQFFDKISYFFLLCFQEPSARIVVVVAVVVVVFIGAVVMVVAMAKKKKGDANVTNRAVSNNSYTILAHTEIFRPTFLNQNLLTV